MLRAEAAGRGLVIDESNWFHPKLVPVGDYRNQQELKQLLRAPISVQGPSAKQQKSNPNNLAVGGFYERKKGDRIHEINKPGKNLGASGWLKRSRRKYANLLCF